MEEQEENASLTNQLNVINPRTRFVLLHNVRHIYQRSAIVHIRKICISYWRVSQVERQSTWIIFLLLQQKRNENSLILCLSCCHEIAAHTLERRKLIFSSSLFNINDIFLSCQSQLTQWQALHCVTTFTVCLCAHSLPILSSLSIPTSLQSPHHIHHSPITSLICLFLNTTDENVLVNFHTSWAI